MYNIFEANCVNNHISKLQDFLCLPLFLLLQWKTSRCGGKVKVYAQGYHAGDGVLN